MPWLRSRLARLGQEESGFGVIEVLASALVLAIVSVGVLKTMDAANAASGNQRARAIAADVAQQDQERMRAFRAKELSNLNSTYTRDVGGVTYTVTSAAIWVNDGSGTRRCGQTSGRADYLQISSSVTWAKMLGAAPVTSTSLYAPPSGSFGDQGSLGFEVLGRTANGQAGVNVSIAGPVNRSGVTDANGCIFFSFLPEGDYTATVSKPGWVTPQGATSIVDTYGVKGGTTQVQPLDYDQAGSLVLQVRSKKATLKTDGTQPSAGIVTVNALADYETVTHSQLASPGSRIFGSGALAGPDITISGMYPFNSPYAMYTGNCAGTGGNSDASVTAATALTAGGSVTTVVNEPALAIYAAKSGTTNGTPTVKMPQGTVVKLTSDPPCAAVTTTYAMDNVGFIAPSSMASSTDPGVPSGTYDICVSYGGRKRIRTNVAITNTALPTHVIVPNVNSGVGADPSGNC